MKKRRAKGIRGEVLQGAWEAEGDFITTIYTVWLREMKRFIRARSRLVASLVTPFFWLAFVGIGLNSAFSLPGENVNYLDFLAPGIISMTILFSSVFSGISVVWDRQFGFLKEMLVAPVSRFSIVIGKVLGGMTVALINGIIVLLIAVFVLNVKVLGITGLFSALAFMIVLSIAFVALGVAVASTLRDPQGFQLIMNFLILPMFFLSGALFPLNNVPVWLKTLSYVNPMTYGVDGIRGSTIGIAHFPILLDFAVIVGFSAVFIYLGAKLFKGTSV